MNRIELLNNIIKKYDIENYMEIGVFYGKCFLEIQCKRKIAVDPDFRIPWEIRKDNFKKKIKRKFLNQFDLYYKKTSDEFFREDFTILQKHPPSLVFIDGLHTYEQTLKDVENSLDYLSDDGIIVLHDCNPENEIQALPAISYQSVVDLKPKDWDGVWNGDVWKTIAHLRSQRNDIEVVTLNTDCGLGIVRKKKSEISLNMSINEIKTMSYSDLEKNRIEILNLVELENFIL
jgi:hypothetical protein